MPTSPQTECSHPSGCHTLVDGDASRCPVHGRASSTVRGYGTGKWARFRLWYLNTLNALCADGIGLGAICGGRLPGAPVTTDSQCLAEGRETMTALQVDHIRPVTGPNDPTFYQPTALQALCASCHGRKTMTERGR